MSGFGALAYIVQINLPGGPIKIGHSCRVRSRLHSFTGGTPVDVRLIGVTFPGAEREQEMLAATQDSIIKGEWRLVTPELRALVAGWVDAGEWFSECGNHRRHFAEMRVAERAKPHLLSYMTEAGRADWEAHRVAAKAGAADPSLLADWHGFARAEVAPDFHWPSLKQAAA